MYDPNYPGRDDIVLRYEKNWRGHESYLYVEQVASGVSTKRVFGFFAVKLCLERPGRLR